MKSIILFSYLVLLSINCLWAHPHVFIKAGMVPVFNSKGLQGLKITWLFDEKFSSFIKNNYNSDNDPQFSKIEQQKIQTETFANLVNFDYLTFVKVDNKILKIKQIHDFRVGQQDKQVYYSFFIPCFVKVTWSYRKVAVGQKDFSNYVNLVLTKEEPPLFDITYDVVREVVNNKEFQGFYMDEMVFKFKKTRFNKR